MKITNEAQSRKLVFFAYKGRTDGHADENVDAIKRAIEIYNQYQSTYLAKSWEEYRKTTAISREILEVISSCEVFVADLTYLNYNVLFELGYAIAKDKNILVLLNETIQGAKSKYQDFILKDIRWTHIANSASIATALQENRFKKQLNTFVNLKSVPERTTDIFYLKSRHPNQASLDLTQYLGDYKEIMGSSIVTADPTEISYQPLPWYFQNLFRAHTSIFHMLGIGVENEQTENAKYSFLAGVACGLGHPVIILAPAKFRAPLDYHEILVQYNESADLISQTESWLEEYAPSSNIEVLHYPKERDTNLLKLGVGCDIAEEERESLLSYFIETSSYHAALKYDKSILVGRKGSGKSAIYIKLFDELCKNDAHYIVALKPESDELLQDVETSDLFNSPASKRSFFFSVWKFVIYSKLIQFINDDLTKKPEHHTYSFAEKELLDFHSENKDFINLNFFGAISEINKRSKSAQFGASSPEILEQLYKSYLSPLLKIIKAYFQSINAKYIKIVIMADNLDKTWDPKHELDLQSEMILTLLEIENKIRYDLTDKQGCSVDVKEIIFLRKDTFEYILKHASEPDKLVSASHEIDWERYPHLLRQLIDNRFRHILNLENDNQVEIKAWRDLFEQRKKHPYDVIMEIITKRPRDLIYFVSKLFESAIDKNHSVVMRDDFEDAIVNYTTFINNNLIAETRTQFPEIVDILSKLQAHHGEKLEFSKFRTIVKSSGYSTNRLNELVGTLFDKGYMVGFDEKTGEPFTDLSLLKVKLKERSFIFFPNKVYVIAHAKYYNIKNRKSSF